MKNSVIILIITILFAGTASGQSQTVSFIHGHGNVPAVWNTMHHAL